MSNISFNAIADNPPKVLIGTPLGMFLNAINGTGGPFMSKVVSAIILAVLTIIVLLQYNNSTVFDMLPHMVQTFILKVGPIALVMMGLVLGGLVIGRPPYKGSYDGGSGFQHPFYTTGANDPKGMSDNHLPQY